MFRTNCSSNRRRFLRFSAATAITVPSFIRNRIANAHSPPEKQMDPYKDGYTLLVDGTARMLSVLDGVVWFPVAGNDGPTFRRDYPTARPIRAGSFVWIYKEDHLRIFLRNDRMSKEIGLDPAHDEINGFYLTADYSTVPPRVVLKPKPTDGSQWSIEAVENPRTQYSNPKVGQKYIRNVNQAGIPAWLHWGIDQFRRVTKDNFVMSLSQPILSFDKKAVFHVGSYIGMEGIR